MFNEISVRPKSSFPCFSILGNHLNFSGKVPNCVNFFEIIVESFGFSIIYKGELYQGCRFSGISYIIRKSRLKGGTYVELKSSMLKVDGYFSFCCGMAVLKEDECWATIEDITWKFAIKCRKYWRTLQFITQSRSLFVLQLSHLKKR